MQAPLLLILSALGTLPNELYRDFRKGEFDFSVTGPGARDHITMEPGGVRIKLPSDHHVSAPIGFSDRNSIHGDFEITVSYAELEVEEPKTTRGTGIELYVVVNSPEQEAASLSHLRTQKGEYFYTAYRAAKGPDGKRQHKVKSAPAKGASGKLRLTRTGSTLSYRTAGDDGEFVPIEQFAIGTSDLELVRVAMNPGGSPTAASALITDLTIRSAESPGEASHTGFSPRALWLVIGFSGLLLSLAVGGLLGWRWYRQR
ncbi:MAG: DUF1583 domain-containing protein [Isosphaeraceae bacterium]|nr:DUF1583 domain-containing protein [Isosphaeraceae bacterium]